MACSRREGGPLDGPPPECITSAPSPRRPTARTPTFVPLFRPRTSFPSRLGDVPADSGQRTQTTARCRGPVPTENCVSLRLLMLRPNGGHAATMYSAVGISGCEPPQPQQFGSKINIIRGLDSDRGLATRNRFCRPLSAAIPKSVDHATGVVHSSTPGSRAEHKSPRTAPGRSCADPQSNE